MRLTAKVGLWIERDCHNMDSRTKVAVSVGLGLLFGSMLGLHAGWPSHKSSLVPTMAESDIGDPKTAISGLGGTTQPTHPEEKFAEAAALLEEPEPHPRTSPEGKAEETRVVPVSSDPTDDDPVSTSETRIEGRLVMFRSHKGVVKDGPFYSWHESGVLSATGSYKNDQREGVWFYHYENGQISRTGSYVNDLEHGEWIQYRENGTVARRETYHAGKLHGRCEEYDEDGQLLTANEYENGTKLAK